MTGPNLPIELAEHVSVALTSALGEEVYAVAGGLEDARSAYLMLSIKDRKYLLLERRTDDGEWAPLLYDSPVHTSDPQSVYRAARSIGAYAQELGYVELSRRWGREDEADEIQDVFGDALWEALYDFRDNLGVKL